MRRLSLLALWVVTVLGAKNPECPNELASEECEDDCIRANTECILECDDGNCIRECSREYTRCESKCPCFDECFSGCPCSFQNDYCPKLHDKVIACYFNNWSQYRQEKAQLWPADIPSRLCTHIIYAFANIPEGNNTIVPTEWNDISILYPAVMEIREKNAELKVLLAVGGWNAGSEGFSSMVATKENRTEFIENAIQYLRENDFDGIDLDWEYPADRGSPPEDKENFALLCEELRAAFELEAGGEERLLLTAAVPANKEIIENGYDVPRLSKSLDLAFVMAYDLNGPWNDYLAHSSPLYDHDLDPNTSTNVDYVIKLWLEKGLSENKLVMGAPTFGYSYQMVNEYSHNIGDKYEDIGPPGPIMETPGSLAFYEICSSQWHKVYDSGMKSVYAFKDDDWVAYDNVDTLRIKCDYINSLNLAGVMFWDLSMDDFTGDFCDLGKFPLISLFQTCLI